MHNIFSSTNTNLSWDTKPQQEDIHNMDTPKLQHATCKSGFAQFIDKIKHYN